MHLRLEQHQKPTVLHRPVEPTGDIFFAESDRSWILNGAAVRVSMVGFDDGSESGRTLDGAPADTINSDLTGALDLTSAIVLSENTGICFYGSQQKGSFEISLSEACRLLSELNPFGLDVSEVVRPSLNAARLLRRTPESWVIDFGVDTTLDQAALYEGPFEYVRRVVYPERKNRSEKRQREFWWLHARPSPRYRSILTTQRRYIASPAVAKHRLFVWLDNRVLANHSLLVFARDDDYFFGVLHSRAHEIWSLRMGTFLGVGNDPRYTPTTCFETYPMPWAPGGEPEGDPRVEAISDAAARLDTLRRNWLDPEGATAADLKKRTLTNLYNARPTWLDNAHRSLDEAVFEAYGWPLGISDEDILKELLALNMERSESAR
jgi:hypothetical protein